MQQEIDFLTSKCETLLEDKNKYRSQVESLTTLLKEILESERTFILPAYFERAEKMIIEFETY